MEKLQRLRDHPVVAILIWVPAILFLPGEWITIGGVVTDDANLTRLVLAFAGLGAILYASGRFPFGAHAVASDKEQTATLGPEERLKIMDDMFFPAADPRRELGEECQAFAIKVRVTCEWYEDQRISNTARVAREAVEADPELDMEQAYKDARSLIERNLEAQYALELRDEGLKLFDQAREQDAILARYRREVEQPNAFALEEVANIFRAIARRLGVDVSEPEPMPKAKYLAESLDALIRDGMDLRHELEAPVEPEETSPGNWRVDGGVPDGWWEKVNAFDGCIRQLLRAERPALLSTYAEGHNATARQLREADERREPPDHKADRRSNAQKMLVFANATREGPMLHMDCILDGLSAARRQFGLEHH